MLILLLFFMFGSVFAAQTSSRHIARDAASAAAAVDKYRDKIEWLSKNAVSVRSIDPEDDNFADLQPLKKLINNARIVQLGEQSHQAGATFLAKQRLVRFLHEQMGFDVLAWESEFSGCEEWNDALLSGAPPRFGAGSLLRAAIEYPLTTLKTGHPLRLSGFDIEFNDDPRSRLFQRIDALDPELMPDADRKWIEQLCTTGLFPNYSPARGEHELRRDAVARVLDRLRRSPIARSNPREMLYLTKLLENILNIAEYRAGLNARKIPAPDMWTQGYRDRKMGANLVWLAREWYSDRKIIAWAATFHVARNLNTIDPLTDEFSYRNHFVMGDVVHQALGADVYTIFFTAYGGKAGNKWSGVQTLPPTSPGSLEALLHATQTRYALIDFRSLPQNHWLRTPMRARPLGHTREFLANWPNVFDAAFYIDEMFPDIPTDIPAGVLTSPRE